MIQTHLLLMMNKASPEYEESVLRYQKAAKLFQGQVSWEWSPPGEDGVREKDYSVVSGYAVRSG